jgi:hypothetical protein
LPARGFVLDNVRDAGFCGVFLRDPHRVDPAHCWWLPASIARPRATLLAGFAGFGAAAENEAESPYPTPPRTSEPQIVLAEFGP